MPLYFGGTQIGGTATTFPRDDVVCGLIDGSITEISNSDITEVKEYFQYKNQNLRKIDFPNVTTIGQYAFYNCTSIETVNAPKCTTISQRALYNCYISEINLPEVTTIDSYGLYGNNFNILDLPKCIKLGSYALANCTGLIYVALGSPTMCTGSSTMLNSALMMKNYGVICVPDNLIDTYKANTYWKTYADCFRGFTPALNEISNNIICLGDEAQTHSIEYSIGYPFAEYTVSVIADESMLTVSNISIDMRTITFDVAPLTTAGTSDIVVTITRTTDGFSLTKTYTMTLIEMPDSPSVEFTPVTSNLHSLSNPVLVEFMLDSDGWYTYTFTENQSGDAGYQNALFINRLTIISDGSKKPIIDIIGDNFNSEITHKYEVSNIDTQLARTSTTGIFSSGNLVEDTISTIDMGSISLGIHTIDIRITADDGDNGGYMYKDTTFKIRVRFEEI